MGKWTAKKFAIFHLESRSKGFAAVVTHIEFQLARLFFRVRIIGFAKQIKTGVAQSFDATIR
jgi:hypothetical protein